MRNIAVPAFMIALLFCLPCRAQDKATIEKTIRDGIVAWRTGLASEDEAKQLATLKDTNPTLQDLKALVGDKAELIWPPMHKWLSMMEKDTDGLRKEMARHGEIRKIRLIDVRSDTSTKRYQRILDMIPKTIPVYRAVIHYSKGSAGTGTFLLIDGRFKVIRGLEAIPEMIEMAEKQKK